MTEEMSAAVKKKPSAVQQVLEIAVMLAIAFILAFLIRTFLVQPFIIPTGSMIPTIEISDRVLVDKVSYHFRAPKARDVVTFPDPTGEYETLIKRVIATSGDIVDIRDGKLYINGKAQDEPYVHGKQTNVLYGSTITYPYTVPKGEVWLMGDNRTNSADSRIFGAQPASKINGRAFFIYWPPKDIGKLD